MNRDSSRARGLKARVVIIGGGIAGINLATELVRKNRDMKVTVLKKEAHGSYSPCGMPFVLEGKLDRMEDIILHPPQFYGEEGIILRTETEAMKIDTDERSVELSSGETLDYDVLVLATGRRPFIPPIAGADLKGVYTLSSYEDGSRIALALRGVKKAVILGGGIIGLESATAFAKKNINTTVIELLPSVLPQILDPDMASLVLERLEDMGIEVLTSTKVTSIKGERMVEAVVTGDKEIEADSVLVATGVRPNVDLAKSAGLTIGSSGGIVTNSRLNVENDGRILENVFGLGDCIEVRNAITHLPQISALASTATLQARMVAENICGGDEKMDGYLNPIVTVIGDLHIGSVGLTSHTAEQAGLEPDVVEVTGLTRSRYYPGRKQMHIKLLGHEGRLVGAQIISEEDVKERINAIVLAIQNKIKITDLLYTERCYSPPLSLLMDPLTRGLEGLGGDDA